MMKKAGGLDIVGNNTKSRNKNRKNRDGNSSNRNGRSKPGVRTGIALVLTALALFMAMEDPYSITAHAVQDGGQEKGTAGRVRSKGRMCYERAVIDGADLRIIDEYISGKKNAAAGILVQLGTRFRLQSGEYVYDRNPDAGQEEINLDGMSWSMLTQAAEESQSVPPRLAVLNPEAALCIEGVEERTDFYEAAVEDDLSAGTAAWVDGRLLLGNGADNEKAYRQGITDGGLGNIPENLCPIYGAQEVSAAIRHAHVGSAMQSEGVSGCYRSYLATVARVGKCDLALQYASAEWRPNESESGGGSWHGDYYTCPHHGGFHDSPGICGQDYAYYETEWRCETICGLGNMLYAGLTIKATGGKQACLNAVLEKGEGYGRLAWKEGDELVWTDEKGNVLGIGPDLTVSVPGIYRCNINVANADISCRMAEAVVTVSGLMIRGN
ncbi:MAG: hypothetical protein NC416_09105 [Eubacterium sp.]|nr:hypothetical protein [Eubacterium sp.]